MPALSLVPGVGATVLSLPSLYTAIGVIFAVNIAVTLLQAFYNLFLHPLKKFPGPKLWIAFPFIKNIVQMQGRMDIRIRDFHEKYGEVVRYGVNELSFIDAQAWKDIYGNTGHKELPKWLPPGLGLENEGKIVFANAQDHFKYRRAMLPAFSNTALAQQEPLMKVYIDLLVKKLRESARAGRPQDAVRFYTFTTFDLIGDLCWGESFGVLEADKPNQWLEDIQNINKLMLMMLFLQIWPAVAWIMLKLSSGKMKKSREEHQRRASELTMRRIGNKDKERRGDFMDFIMRSHGQEHGLTDFELASNADTLIIAGSETTATLLSGVTYWLLRTPQAMKRCVDEVRGAFEKEEDISFTSASAKLPYMLACLDEGLRMFPPVPTILSRQTLPGPPTHIAGYEVPPKTKVGVHQLSAFHSKTNYYHADHFEPERWLQQSQTDPKSPYFNDNREVHKPFSYGRRDCIGRNLAYHEMRLILAKVLYNFDLELRPEGMGWAETQKTWALWDKPPLMVNIKERRV